MGVPEVLLIIIIAGVCVAMWLSARNGRVSLTDQAESKQYQIRGRTVACPSCGGNRFVLGVALLNTRGMTLFGFDWADRQSYTLTCVECSHITWFANRPDNN